MKKRFLIFWLPVLVYMGLIFVLSALPEIPGSDIFPYQDKIAHFLVYGGLGFFLWRAIRREPKLSSHASPHLWAVFFGTVYGGFDELHQKFVPGRSPDWKDLFMDFFGLIGVQVLIYLFSAEEKKNEK